MDRNKVIEQLVKHEGMRTHPYICSAGKITIGVGRNIEDDGISEEEAMYLLEGDIDRVDVELQAMIPGFRDLDDIRQSVLMDMCFNLGADRFGQFQKMIKAVRDGDWVQAACEMRKSKWAKQVGQRAERLAKMMESGKDVP